jgi:N-sulfoglucosamine sulfohydrolase
MRHYVLIFLFCLPILLCLRAADVRPNFILYITDDVTWDDLGCYGDTVAKTPHIDKLASQGIRFDNAYLTISSCSPSRCSLITGRYPHNTGACELHTQLPQDQPLFPKLLKDAGYYTALSGKHHMGNKADIAFDKISKGKGPGKQEDWVDLLQDRPKNKPFFFWFASTDAHRGWQLDENTPKYNPEDIHVPAYLFDGPKTRKDLAEYYHEVSRTDHFVGELIKELKQQNVLSNTYILCMTDNGRPFPRCKTRLFDSGIKTPLIIAGPNIPHGSTTTSLVSSIDIGPTFLELAGVKKDSRIQGVSFARILCDTNARTRDYVFAEHNWHVYQAHERLVRWKNWTLIRNAFPEKQNLCMESDPSFPSGTELWDAHRAGKLNPRQLDIFLQPRPKIELYDLSKDPDQLHNVADVAENKEIRKKLLQILDRWAKQTADSVPQNITNDRQLPDGTRLKTHKRGDQPGVLEGSLTNNHPGPLLEKP